MLNALIVNICLFKFTSGISGILGSITDTFLSWISMNFTGTVGPTFAFLGAISPNKLSSLPLLL